MTSMNAKNEVLKLDARGRVRVTKERRAVLLDEFEKSGVSGAEFARLAGIKYATFANWVQKRREQRKEASAMGRETGSSTAPLRLLEAVVEGDHPVPAAAATFGGLVIELPGGCSLRVDSPGQLEMATELVYLIAQRGGGRC